MASATPVEVISLVGILRYFKDYDSLIEKGNIKYANGYVLQIRILEMNIEGLVRSSMGDKSYAINIAVDGSGNILNSSCGCYRGTWLCSHVAATAIYAGGTQGVRLPPPLWIFVSPPASLTDNLTFLPPLS